MLRPYDEKTTVAPVVDVIKRPASWGIQQEDFETENTFSYNEIYVEDRLHGVVKVYPKEPSSASYGAIFNAMCGSVSPIRLEWSNADYMEYKREDEFNCEDTMYTSVLDNLSKCGGCLKRECSKSQAYIMCFKCDSYLCEKCECSHSDEFKIEKTKTQQENTKVTESILDDMIHSGDIEKEFDIIKVDIADKIFVKHDIDESDCYITGLCVLDDGRIVVIDYSNSAVKVFRQSQLEKYLKLSTRPFDVTEIKNSSQSHINKLPIDKHSADLSCKLAITCPAARTVLILEIAPEQPIRKTCIRVDAMCLGIDYTTNCLVAVCKDPKHNDRLGLLLVSENGEISRFVDANVSSSSLYAYIHINSGSRVSSSLSNIFGSLGVNWQNGGVVLTFGCTLGQKSCEAIEQEYSNKTITYTDFNCLRVSTTLWKSDKESEFDSDSTFSYFETEIGQKAMCMYGDAIYVSESFEYENRNFITVFKVI